jgi:hypothetical protein
MKLATLLLASLLAFAPTAMAFDKDGTPANEVEAAYKSAKPQMSSAPLKEGETLQSRAQAWEAFAAKEAHADSTVTGLKGQRPDQPNCRECEGWAWLNAGTAWWKYAKSLEKPKGPQPPEYLSALRKSAECYGKCADDGTSTEDAKGIASSGKANIEELLAKLDGKGK